ncbi:hypothetical protein BJF78_22405 [Pseudonocardia sp. CNS-139]|nr:hypothetical protein BJF78_22405 [Pseudonocardia sp. CNS-139]
MVAAGAAPAPGLRHALAGEIVKARSSRGLRVILLVALLISVGLTALVVVGGGASALHERQTAGEAGSPYEVLFFGPALGVWAYTFFAAHFVAGEFHHGMITYSLAAVPVRHRLLISKLIIVACVGLVAGVAISLVNFGITQGALLSAGYPVLSLGDPALVRVVLVYVPAQMAVWGTIVMSLAAVLRSTAPSVVVVFLGSLLPVAVAPMLPAVWGESVPRWMPGALIESVAGLAVPGSPGYLPPAVAVPVLLIWLVVFLAIALRTFTRRDA